jgi:hypothetical protein
VSPTAIRKLKDTADCISRRLVRPSEASIDSLWSAFTDTAHCEVEALMAADEARYLLARSTYYSALKMDTECSIETSMNYVRHGHY